LNVETDYHRALGPDPAPEQEEEVFYDTNEPGPSRYFNPEPPRFDRPNLEQEPDSDDDMAANGKKELALNKPTPFDGSRTRVKDFLQECYLYLEVNKDVYDSNEKKIGFILSYMSEKEAALWKKQFITTITDAQGSMTFLTYTTFITKVRDDFKQEDEVRSAANQLEALRQGKKTAEELVTEFKLLVGKAALTDSTTSDHVHLIRMFQRALNPRLANRILYADVVPTTITDWYKCAIQYDANFRMAQALILPSKGQSSSPANYSRYWRNEKPKDPNTMDVDRMTIEERNDLMKKGACFGCKEPGHRVMDCPKKKKTFRPNQRGTFKKDAKRVFTDIRALSIEQKNELRDMMISSDLKEDDKEEENEEDF